MGNLYSTDSNYFLIVRDGFSPGEYINVFLANGVQYKDGYGVCIKEKTKDASFAINEIAMQDILEPFFSMLYKKDYKVNSECGSTFRETRYDFSFFSFDDTNAVARQLHFVANYLSSVDVAMRVERIDSACVPIIKENGCYSIQAVIDLCNDVANRLIRLSQVSDNRYDCICLFGP